MFHEFTPWRDCDRGYGRSSWRPRVPHPAAYRSGTPRVQHPVVARWHGHLHGLATAIHEISGLGANVRFVGPILSAMLLYLGRRILESGLQV